MHSMYVICKFGVTQRCDEPHRLQEQQMHTLINQAPGPPCLVHQEVPPLLRRTCQLRPRLLGHMGLQLARADARTGTRRLEVGRAGVRNRTAPIECAHRRRNARESNGRRRTTNRRHARIEFIFCTRQPVFYHEPAVTVHLGAPFFRSICETAPAN